jgi:hypothetical protein
MTYRLLQLLEISRQCLLLLLSLPLPSPQCGGLLGAVFGFVTLWAAGFTGRTRGACDAPLDSSKNITSRANPAMTSHVNG